MQVGCVSQGKLSVSVYWSVAQKVAWRNQWLTFDSEKLTAQFFIAKNLFYAALDLVQ